MKVPLSGIVPPVVTPLLNRDSLDEEGFEKLVEHILAGGVHGLFVLGTTGEAPSLGYNVRSEVVSRACRQVNKRVPVLVGITDTVYSESVALAKKAADCGADAVVLAPPYYFSAGQPELIEYVQHMVEDLPLPLFLYNMPGCTKIHMDPETVRHLAQLDKVAGLKDSSGNMVYFHKCRELLKDNDDFRFLVGPEELLAESVLLGGHGGVCGGANMFPQLYVDLYNAAKSGDLATTRRLHQKVIEISNTVYRVGKHGSSFLKSVKTVLNLMGICNDFVSEPFHRFRTSERDIIQKLLDSLEV
ncbi:dihydrodipicolinate synthase family protein [Tichowtungia aerotolerans]|uniref:Dihydrodipicolinate synthase family protein n=2 Tax=Tichowtungia aerotolerans TaxID=2697043 RepID=A0A6P1M5C0_9BACT|nr:dihydrodipicolinate synthase family protein [Tichowtungia aerotolerans]QHI69047.1 dihydrodipicolinate synthase family protein [Tichowtungia aerotolerans]